MSCDGLRLRESLLQSLRAKPLLIEAEASLHGPGLGDRQQKLFSRMVQTLESEALLAQADRLGYPAGESEVIRKFRAAMADSLKGGENLAEAERGLLESLGFERLGSLRTKMQAHLSGPTQVPEQDVEIYVPAGKGTGEAFKRALEQQMRSLTGKPDVILPGAEGQEPYAGPSRETGEAQPALPREEDALPRWIPPAAQGRRPKGEPGTVHRAEILPGRQVPGPQTAQVAAPATTPGTKPEAPQGLNWLNPVPLLATALEEIGVEDDDFGYLLKYGKYAPTGRTSEFIVAGLGLGDLSKRLTSWLDAQGPTEYQVQVVDDGSGELTIYLASAVGSNGVQAYAVGQV
jgi:hypothetical protein